jgi:hypothetical protein
VSEAKRILHQPTALADRKGGSSHGKEKSKESPGQEKGRREEKETLVSN